MAAGLAAIEQRFQAQLATYQEELSAQKKEIAYLKVRLATSEAAKKPRQQLQPSTQSAGSGSASGGASRGASGRKRSRAQATSEIIDILE